MMVSTQQKQWSSGNIDEQSGLLNIASVLVLSSKTSVSWTLLDVRWLANIDYTVWSMFGKHSQRCDRCLANIDYNNYEVSRGPVTGRCSQG